MSSWVSRPPPSTPSSTSTLHPFARMRLLRPIRLFLALVALTAASTITSAQDASFFDPKKSVSDGQPVHDNALLVPLNGQLASNRIDVLLLPSKLRSRQQVPTCATNYTVCQGSDFCCPEGNACCPGESSRSPALGQHIRGRTAVCVADE